MSQKTVSHLIQQRSKIMVQNQKTEKTLKECNDFHTISIIGTLPPIRALSSYCFELVNALSPIHPVEFISFKKIYPPFLYPGGHPDDDHTYPKLSTKNIKIKTNLTWYNPLSWLIEGLTAKGDLLHAQWWSTPLFPIYLVICACFKLKKKPVMFTIHNVLPHEKSSVFSKLSHYLFKLGDYFIVHSNINKRQMNQTYEIPLDKIAVIPHGSLDFHIKANVDRDNLRKKYKITPENKVLLLFGAIRPYKGVETAIKALSQIIQTLPETRLLIAGRLWEDWTPYHRLISRLELNRYIITHLDYIPSGDVYTYFEISDMCLFPYHHFDSQSGAASVALSFRKPMIVSNVGGLPELVNHPHCIVPPSNPNALARSVIRCLRNPTLLKQMASDAEIISHQFSWADIAEKTSSVYKHLLKHPV